MWIMFNLLHCVRMDGLSVHFWDIPWGPCSICFFFGKYRVSPSCWPGCRCNFIDCGGRGTRMQYLIAIEVNLSQLYLDSKLSTIEPQSCGLQKKRSSIASGLQGSVLIYKCLHWHNLWHRGYSITLGTLCVSVMCQYRQSWSNLTRLASIVAGL